MLQNILVTIVVFLTMEGITWCTHKFVMHGFLWHLHEDHHNPDHKQFFQKNDWFFVIFSVPSILLFYFGQKAGYNYLFFIGLGILLYGMAYFFVHEIVIHQRYPMLTNTRIKYFRGLKKAHRDHHKHLVKQDGECFGMLHVPSKYFKELE
jgi:beta-carotene 3-hydroxylase